jgi:hypothetical protein
MWKFGAEASLFPEKDYKNGIAVAVRGGGTYRRQTPSFKTLKASIPCEGIEYFCRGVLCVGVGHKVANDMAAEPEFVNLLRI